MVTNNYATATAKSNYDASTLSTVTLDAHEIKSNVVTS